MKQPRPAARLCDAVADILEQRILEGSLKPGAQLPSERDLALELGVSRPSLREAIQKLVSKGMLATRHGLGIQVTDRLQAHFSDPWQEMLQGHPGLQGDLLEFRQMLEGQAAALAAQRATKADIERLDAAFSSLETAYLADDLQTCIDADVAFHQVIAEASHNVVIGHLTASLMRVIHGHVAQPGAPACTSPALGPPARAAPRHLASRARSQAGGGCARRAQPHGVRPHQHGRQHPGRGSARNRAAAPGGVGQGGFVTRPALPARAALQQVLRALNPPDAGWRDPAKGSLDMGLVSRLPPMEMRDDWQ